MRRSTRSNRRPPSGFGLTVKPSASAKRSLPGWERNLKKAIPRIAGIANCRLALRGPVIAWLDAALAIGADGDPVSPAMLGTGDQRQPPQIGDNHGPKTCQTTGNAQSMENTSRPDSAGSPD